MSARIRSSCLKPFFPLKARKLSLINDVLNYTSIRRDGSREFEESTAVTKRIFDWLNFQWVLVKISV